MSEPTGWTVPGDAPPPSSPYGPPPSGPAVPEQQLPPTGVPGWFAPPQVGGLGVAVLALSGLHLVTKAAEAVLAFPAETELMDGLAGPSVAALGGAGAVELVVRIATWVVASIWLMRLHRAASAASPGSMRRSAVWTWLGWWVPVVLLWFPKQIVDDVWRVAAAQPGRAAAGPTGGWWAWWLVALLTDRMAGSLLGRGGGAGFTVLTALCTAVAYFYWFRVVRGVSAAHDAGPWTTGAAVPPRPSADRGYGTN